eukprot:364326-Chlamydomonas_euryale.AAC.13
MHPLLSSGLGRRPAYPLHGRPDLNHHSALSVHVISVWSRPPHCPRIPPHSVPQAWCTSPEVGLPAPDVVFYMRTNAGASAARSGFGEERYERGDFQRAVAAQFEVLACGGNEGSAGRKGGFGEGKGVWVAVDATQPIDAIHAHVRSIVDELLANGGERLAAPVQRMQAVRSSGAGVCDAPGDAAAVVELRGAGAAGKGVPTQPQLQAQPREQQ